MMSNEKHPSEILKQRTKRLAIRVIALYRKLPREKETLIIGEQLLRSVTSVAANYRAACRARSTAEFIAKLGIVVEEADETAFWLELIVDTELVSLNRIEPLTSETEELLAIFCAARTTTRQNNQKSKIKNRK